MMFFSIFFSYLGFFRYCFFNIFVRILMVNFNAGHECVIKHS